MSEIFLKEDLISLLDNRFIVIIGDSIQRGVYKDLVILLQKNQYLSDRMLRAKGERSFLGDTLIEGGQLGEMTNGVAYREVRQYQTDNHLVRFYFVTRCYNTYMESILLDLSDEPLPDVFMMNSCLWDISRYGRQAVGQYKENVHTLFKRIKEILPPTCLIMWNTTLPISKKARGGVLIPAIEFMNSTLRLDILEANFYVHKLAMSFGFNVLDLHYFLRHQLQRRAGDGVHWDMTAHRRITNLILTHIAQAWGMKLPKHTRNLLRQNENNPVIDRCRPDQTLNEVGQYFSNQFPMRKINVKFSQNVYNNVTTLSQQNGNQFNENQDFQFGFDLQQSNIDRYGGPIREPTYFASEQEIECSMLNEGQFSWEPYGNRNFDPNLHGRMYNGRMQPYGNKRQRSSNYNYY